MPPNGVGLQTNIRNEPSGRAMRLVEVVQALSAVRTIESIVDIVRQAARELSGADGATFILRDGDQCHYVDEDAISPLWKGRKFPMSACISGWSMLHRETVVIEDIYSDARIPHVAYQPTFVKSLAMVPIRTRDPVGAIGIYWAKAHVATPTELELLEALANTTSVALENVRLYEELENRVRDRTVALEEANRELETFSYSVSHDLQGPVRHINGYIGLLLERHASQLDDEGKSHLARIGRAAKRMGGLTADLLRLAQLARTELKIELVELGLIAKELANNLREEAPSRAAEFRLAENLQVKGDGKLLRIVMENLLANAWKFTAKRDKAVIEFGSEPGPGGEQVCFVRDNGAGFDMQHAGRLFKPFQRLHTESDFAGSGVGLATVDRIIRRHGGRIWVDSAVDQGTTFRFTTTAGTSRIA